MSLPIYFFKENKNKPAIVFIHGLGINDTQWLSPSETKILGGVFPLSVLTRTSPEPLKLIRKPTILPEKLIPLEWKQGEGLVLVESATDCVNSGKVFELNHAEIIVNTD